MYYVYILSNQKNKVLYIGVTNNLKRRVCEHKNALIKGFTQKYRIDKLVYFERFYNINYAIKREKQLKGLLRIKKIQLINDLNPKWDDLFEKI